MNEYIARIADAAEAKDIEELKKINGEMLFTRLWRSYLTELTRTPYFPSLCPELSGNIDKQEVPEELQKHTENPENNPDFSIILVPYDEGAIKEIADYDFISLFEVALLIGYRVENDPRALLSSFPALFADAIINRLIDPRDPRSHIPYSKTHKTPHVIDGKVEFFKEIPDMSWQLTLKESAEFAILKGYPAEFFEDMIKPNRIDSKTVRPEVNPMQKPVNTDLDPRERSTLLSIIAALCEKSGTTADERGLARELAGITERLGIPVSEKAIKDHLKKVAELVK